MQICMRQVSRKVNIPASESRSGHLNEDDRTSPRERIEICAGRGETQHEGDVHDRRREREREGDKLKSKVIFLMLGKERF